MWLDAPTKAHSEQLSTITTEAAKMAERDSTVDMFDGSFVLAPTDSMFPIDSAMWEFNERLLDEPSPSGESIASSLEDNLIDALTALQAERARNDRLQLQIEVARSLAPGGCPSDRVLAAVLSLQSAARASSFSQSSRLRAVARARALDVIRRSVRSSAPHRALRRATRSIAARRLWRALRQHVERLRHLTKSQLVSQFRRQREPQVSESTCSRRSMCTTPDEQPQRHWRQQWQRSVTQEVATETAAAEAPLVADLESLRAQCEALMAQVQERDGVIAQFERRAGDLARRLEVAKKANLEQVEKAREREQSLFQVQAESAALRARLQDAGLITANSKDAPLSVDEHTPIWR